MKIPGVHGHADPSIKQVWDVSHDNSILCWFWQSTENWSGDSEERSTRNLDFKKGMSLSFLKA